MPKKFIHKKGQLEPSGFCPDIRAVFNVVA